jgi:hypothetical protein
MIIADLLDRDFSRPIAEMVNVNNHDQVKAQPWPEHKKTIFHNPDGDARYILIKPTEPGREIIVTTQLYDIPTP